MCEQTEVNYLDGDVVWVKLGSCWWPGAVVGSEKLPPDLLRSFRKPPIAVVKFFQEDTYEYVKNINSIYKYNCSRKNEFINKGLYMFRTKHGHMEKFPDDVIRAETAIGGDSMILTRDEFQEKKKESYAGLFGDAAKRTPGSGKKSRGGKTESPRVPTPVRKLREKVDYKVHILVQGSKPAPNANSTSEAPETTVTPSTSTEPEPDKKDEGNNEASNENQQPTTPVKTSQTPVPSPSTPTASVSGMYSCHACSFSTNRLNVLILHNKTHSISFTPYTPSPVRKKLTPTPKSTPKTTKTPKVRKPKKETTDREPKKSQANKKRAAEEKANAEVKKVKTDEEIKSSLLADWDDGDEESNDESSTMVMAGSPEVPETAESPAVPTSADSSSLPISGDAPVEKKTNSPTSEKPEVSNDSKYEFCEDEDWHVEEDAGRKIPRVKNPKRKEDSKSLSLDEDDVAREVAELLNKTTVPELPAAPEPLKVEENFPEPSIVKSPDKQEKSPETTDKPPETPPTKAIFKTKTFFRSRHSRSQDVIGKYVAEQLNAVERMDVADSETNGSEIASSPEARESPPIEQVKVARLAPKIQLKKMKAEAAQRERHNIDQYNDIQDLNRYADIMSSFTPSPDISQEKDDKMQDETSQDLPIPDKPTTDVLYPTQEIKPVYTEELNHVKSVLNKTDVFNSHKDAILVKALPETITKIDDVQTTSLEISHSNNITDVRIDAWDTNKDIDAVTDIPAPTPEIMDHVMKDDETTVDRTVNEIDRATTETDLTESGNDKLDDKMEWDTSKEPEEVTDIVSNELNDLNNEMDVTNTEIEVASNNETDVNTNEMVTNNVSIDEVVLHNDISNEKQSENDALETSLPDADISETKIEETSKQQAEPSTNEQSQPYMNESTASAVDALLSVSREADRVTRVVSDDLPEDLFEDDNKDVNVNGYSNFSSENIEISGKTDEVKDNSKEELIDDCDELKNCKKSDDSVSENMIVEDSVVINEAGNDIAETVVESVPSESDLQIAETLLNLPSTAIQSKTNNDIQIDSLNVPEPIEEVSTVTDELAEEPPTPMVKEEKILEPVKPKENVKRKSKSLLIPNNDNLLRFETEQEKSENLNAAQSLVQMSETIDLKLNMEHNINDIVNTKDVSSDNPVLNTDQNNGLDSVKQVVQTVVTKPKSKNIEKLSPKMDLSSSKLLKILEEPSVPKTSSSKPIIKKQVIIPAKEKILNFDVGKSTPKQKIIIRRTTTSKNVINKVNDVHPDKIILSRSQDTAQDGTVQTYTIRASPDTPPSDSNTIVIQQNLRKVAKPPTKIQKIKPPNSLVNPVAIEPKPIKETTTTNDDAMFDINSMPIVFTEDLITPESIEKMPFVMSDGSNLLTQTANPPKLVKSKPPEPEKVPIPPATSTTVSTTKPEKKTILMSPVTDLNKMTNAPNILSKSSKLRGAKPMLVIDKTTGKQKIIMAKGEPTVKEVKPTPTLIQAPPQNPSKGEKFIILPTQSSPRPGRTQKIVIDPQTGKAHVLVTKGPEAHGGPTDNKPVSAKLVPSSTDVNASSNTVMIITNAQGGQSRILLTPEHEKMLFPKKQQANVSQLKTITHRITSAPGMPQKTLTTMAAKTTQSFVQKSQLMSPAKTQTIIQPKPPTRIVSKQKSTIITSKGQLIVGGRVTTTAHNMAPMPELRPVPKRIVASEPKKLVQTIQKASAETLIFLQQKSGAVMQLTAAQFEHLQRTGQIVQKASPQEVKPVPPQRKITISPAEIAQAAKPRARRAVTEAPTPVKRLKQEVPVAPSPVPPMSPLVAAAPVVPAIVAAIPSVSNTVSVSSSGGSFSELDNFEDMLPSTAIVRQPEPIPPPPPVAPAPEAQPPLSDGQLLAVPGEHFGGPPGSFYLCVEDNGTLTPIDNRPLVLENNQLVPMAVEPLPVLAAQPERRDILEAALANSDVFHDPPRDEAPDFRDLNANVSVHCRVSETSSTLNQPIMTPVEVPSKVAAEPAVPSSLEDGLAVIGVTPHTVPTSLELPITVTDPRIAPKMADPLGGTNYATTTLLPSPNAEMTYVSAEETVDATMGGPISMPLLTDDDSVGKSMPILTDDVAERTVSSVDSTVGSPSSIDVREEMDDGGQWTRRLLTPGSDTSEASAEIPLQPSIQLSVSDLARHS